MRNGIDPMIELSLRRGIGISTYWGLLTLRECEDEETKEKEGKIEKKKKKNWEQMGI